MQEVHVGKVYKHFKGHQYLVLCIAMQTETNETMVIYQDLHDQDKIYARPYDMFISKVDKEKYPYIQQIYRFQEVLLLELFFPDMERMDFADAGILVALADDQHGLRLVCLLYTSRCV